MPKVSAPPALVEQAVRRFEIEAKARVRFRENQIEVQLPRIITISRQLGSGGRKVAEILGRRLNWQVWNYQILEVLASEARKTYQARMFEAVDENAQSRIDQFLAEFCGDTSRFAYFWLLPKAILTIAQEDAIILGRGAHLILPNAMKVRIIASLGRRIQNLMNYEDLNEQAAQDQIRESDKQRLAFIRKLKQRIRLRPEQIKVPEFDLEINTTHFSVEDASEIIFLAAQKFESVSCPS